VTEKRRRVKLRPGDSDSLHTMPIEDPRPSETLVEPPPGRRPIDIARRTATGVRKGHNWMQLIKFGAVGGTGYVVNLIVFAGLAEGLGVYHLLAAVGAFCVAVTNNFLWNRHWTFEPGDGHPGFQAMRFLAVSLGALAINLVALELLISGTSLGDLPAQAIAVALAMPFNFLGNKLWTFA
jgi:putative flippase GtrA